MKGPWSLVLGTWSLAALLWTGAVLAQDPKVATRDVAVVTGRVERLDPFARSVTLRTSEGLQHTVYAGKELKAFDALRSGDTITVRISESVVVSVRPNAKMTVLEDSTAAAKKGPDAAGRRRHAAAEGRRSASRRSTWRPR